MRFIVSAVIFIFSSATHAQTVLEARINNLREGNVYLWNTTSDQVDTVKITNNVLSYSTSLTEPTFFNLKFEGYNDWDLPIRLVLSKSSTSMVVKELKPAKTGSSWRNIYPNKPEFPDDPNHNKLLFEFEDSWQSFADSIARLTPESDGSDPLLEKRKNLYEGYMQSVKKFVRDHPEKVVTAVAVNEYLIRNRLTDVNQSKELFLLLKDDIKYSVAGTRIGEHINRELAIEIGKPAPYFEFRDVRGVGYNLVQLKGKTVLLHFWSSTCGPCRVQNAEIKDLRKAYKDLVIINVSLDINDDQWRRAIAKDGLTELINTSDLKGFNNKIAQDYYIHGIPSHYLIDSEGKIASKGSLKTVMDKVAALR